ncbi:MAG: response regulator [Burkholderiales bacterium]
MSAEARWARASALYIVDADESVREGLARLTESAGFEPKPCDSAEAFLRLPDRANGACALLDLSDSRLWSPMVRTRLCALAATLPVIALCAHDDARIRRTARELGARAFFRKPVDAAALLDSIRWVMR